MKIDFKKSFTKDLKKIANKSIYQKIKESIEEVERANSLHNVKNLKQLKSTGKYYRISIGDYRVGLKMDGNIVIFVRCLHRKEIYRYFP